MDLSVRQTLLESYDPLYFAWNYRNRRFPDLQPDLQRSGRYIITGHQTGKLLSTFAAMIGFSVANILVSQASGYASTFINLKVDSEIKNDIFSKMLVTDWESLTDYHTGDLVTRWSSDASNISSGILNWIPNLIIYTFRFISALAIVLYYDPTFALFALLGIPFSALLSRPLLRRMRDNNQRSAAMNAKLYGFNQRLFPISRPSKLLT